MNTSQPNSTIPAAPRLSVVVPTYARPRELEACLGALASSELPTDEFEVIVVDDGSPRPLAESLDEVWAERLDLRIVRQANAGPAAARNAGAKLARAAYIAFTDDDCLPEPRWLPRMLATVERHPTALIGGKTVNALPDNRFSTASQLLIDYLHDYFNSAEPEFFPSNNICLSAAGLDALAGFDTGFPLAAGEDRDFCSRWIHHGFTLHYAPDAVVKHAHQLGWRSFWRQHRNYGRGAYHFHVRRSERSRTRLEVEPARFYVRLVLYPFSRGSILRALQHSVLMSISQVANALGYFSERARTRTPDQTTPRPSASRSDTMRSTTDEDLLRQALIRLRSRVMALVFGCVGGVGLFLITAWSLLRAPETQSPNLAVLRHYFPGYHVSWPGAFLGLIYGFVAGAIVGWIASHIYNKVATTDSR